MEADLWVIVFTCCFYGVCCVLRRLSVCNLWLIINWHSLTASEWAWLLHLGPLCCDTFDVTLILDPHHLFWSHFQCLTFPMWDSERWNRNVAVWFQWFILRKRKSHKQLNSDCILVICWYFIFWKPKIEYYKNLEVKPRFNCVQGVLSVSEQVTQWRTAYRVHVCTWSCSEVSTCNRNCLLHRTQKQTSSSTGLGSHELKSWISHYRLFTGFKLFKIILSMNNFYIFLIILFFLTEHIKRG